MSIESIVAPKTEKVNRPSQDKPRMILAMGMLWFFEHCADLASFEVEVQKAADYYWQKYGSHPTVCYVNVHSIPPDSLHASGIAGMMIKPVRSILENHLWLYGGAK